MNFWGPKIAEDAVDAYVNKLSSYSGSSSRRYCQNFITELITIFHLPQPSAVYFRYASKEFVMLTVTAITKQLHNSPYVTNTMIGKIYDARRNVGLSYDEFGSSWYRLRTFESNGIYPDRNFMKKHASYVVEKGRPLIITLNYRTAEENALGLGEGRSVLTRKEVKLLSSLMCSQHWGTRFSLVDDFENSRIIDVSAELLGEVVDDEITNILLDYATLAGNKYFSGIEDFDFVGSDISYKEASNFFRHFRVGDALLLRTLFLHIKAPSMFGTRNYYEDAVSNIFIALEGALVMLQRNDGKSYTSINRSFHRVKFDEIFPNGESIYDFVMDEVFAFGEKRASLVHPQAGADWSWVPYLSHEDYRDYRDILKELLYFSVTSDKLSDPYATT